MFGFVHSFHSLNVFVQQNEAVRALNELLFQFRIRNEGVCVWMSVSKCMQENFCGQTKLLLNRVACFILLCEEARRIFTLNKLLWKMQNYFPHFGLFNLKFGRFVPNIARELPNIEQISRTLKSAGKVDSYLEPMKFQSK